MKKLLSILCALIMVFGLVASPAMASEPKKLNIVTTIFPQYDWVRQVLGENAKNANITLLLDKGVDLHNYQPTADDIIKISMADVFIHVGGVSDGWVDDVVDAALNKNLVVIDLVDVLGDLVQNEKVVEGMQETPHDHDHDDHDHEGEEAHDDHDHEGEEVHEDHDHEGEEAHDDHDHEGEEAHDAHDHEGEEAHDDHDHEGEEAHDDHDHEGEEAHDDHDHEHDEHHEHSHVDEHVWLSLKNAKIVVGYIARVLGEVDPANADMYAKNAVAYIGELDALDGEYKAAVDSAKTKTILFGDRFPFRYLADDYGITYYAAFTGCSAETEASFETVIFLANKVDELGLKSVMTMEGANHKIAETVIQNTKDKNQKELVLNSMQSITANDLDNTYLGIMRDNLEVLKNALN